MIFAPFLLGAQHERNSEEEKTASLFVVTMGKTLNGKTPSLYDKQVMGRSSLLVVAVQSDCRPAKERELLRIDKRIIDSVFRKTNRHLLTKSFEFKIIN